MPDYDSRGVQGGGGGKLNRPEGIPEVGAPERGMEGIESILSRWLKANRLSPGRLDREHLAHRWKELVGVPVSDQTRVVDLNRGILTVEVNSAALLQELATYYQREILETLREVDEFRGVQEIRFRPGSF